MSNRKHQAQVTLAFLIGVVFTAASMSIDAGNSTNDILWMHNSDTLFTVLTAALAVMALIIGGVVLVGRLLYMAFD